MKKTNQTDLDFELINLDETAGWDRLEVEAAVKEEVKEENLVFQGEITISEEELFAETKKPAEPEYLDEDALFAEEEVVEAFTGEEVIAEPEYLDEDALFAEEEVVEAFTGAEVLAEPEYLDENSLFAEREYIQEIISAPKKKSKKVKKKKKQTFWDKTAAAFREMTLLDGVIAATGVLVLAVSIVTVSVFSAAKTAEAQVAAFAPIGEEMEYLTDTGKGTLLAMADSQKLILDEVETEEEITFEYEEKDLEETATINVNMKLTSVQKDLKIKFVNHKTGKLISSVKFGVSIEFANGKAKEYSDDDMDGIIYLKDLAPGKATVTMLAQSGENGIAFNTAPQTITIKDTIEYTKIDVSDEVKTESEVNAAVEDTAVGTEVEAELTDTVDWLASTKTEESSQQDYVVVDRADIMDPSSTAKGFVRMTQTLTTESEASQTTPESAPQPETKPTTESAPQPETKPTTTPESTTQPETKPTPESAPQPETKPTTDQDPQPETKPTTTPESTTQPETKPTTTPESTTQPETKPTTTPESTTQPETKPTTTPESTTQPETKPTTPESTTQPETTTQPESTEPEYSPKNDTVSLLKDKAGNQLYLKNASGEFVEAKFADYYNDNAVFYKKADTASYKYTGWQNIDGKTYYYDANGKPVTGEQVIQGAKYNFDSDGALITGSGTLGIDVSKWNGNIDWNAVKNSGISYVIIRCGYRGSTTGALIEDPKFKANIQGASNAGLKVGIYFFTQAVNEVEAVEEASMTINLIKNYKISYPVFLDVESSGGRADGLDANTRTKVIKAYCETIKNSGYTPGVYANKTWLTSHMNAGELSAYKIWLAQYNSTVTYSGKYDLWQYTEKGKVNGIGGNTDLNLSYLGY